MTGETDAELFIEAQDLVWDSVLSELKSGQKTGHWMWFVIPQLAALGRSNMSQLYGLHDLAEAEAYLADPTLSARLIEVCSLLLLHGDRTPEQILGRIDAMKLRSSMTLYSRVPDANPVFAQVLATFYDGKPCGETVRLLG